MTHQFTLQEIREACLSNAVRWTDAAAQAMWDELSGVARIGAWSSACLQAGKLLEKHLQHELEAPSRGIFRGLKGIPKSRSADSTLESHLHVAGETLRILRNRGAHPTGEVTEEDATLAVVCTLILHGLATPPEAEFPPLAEVHFVPAEQIAREWQMYSGYAIASRLVRGPRDEAITIVESAGVGFYEHILRGISPRTLSRLPSLLSSCKADRHAFGIAVLALLPKVLSTLGGGRANGLQRFTQALGGATGLVELRLLLLKLLPFDAETIESRLARPGGKIAWQLNALRRGGHEAARLLDGDARFSSALAVAAWRDWDGTLAGANSIFVRARHSPKGLRMQLWAEAPTEAVLFHIRGSNKVAAMYRPFGYYLHSAERAADRPQIVEAFLDRVSAADFPDKRQAFVALGLSGALGTTAGGQVARQLLGTITYDHTLDSVRLVTTAGLYLRSVFWTQLRSWLPYVPDEVTELPDLLLVGWTALCNEVGGSELYSLDRFYLPRDARFTYNDLARAERCAAFLGLEALEPGESVHTPVCWEAIRTSAMSVPFPPAAAWVADYFEARGFPLPHVEVAPQQPMPSWG